MHHGEKFNSITHLVAAAITLSAVTVLIVMASYKGDPWKIVSFSIYGFSLFSLYMVSTFYHSFKGNLKKFFRRLDHYSIYLLIAGTYTPFTLVSLRGPWGWVLFGTIWGLAIGGIVYEVTVHKGPRVIPVLLYILMGWLIMVGIKPLSLAIPPVGLVTLIMGGVFYTVGVLFFMLDNKRYHFHGIWHLMVIAGSVFHYLTIFMCVL